MDLRDFKVFGTSGKGAVFLVKECELTLDIIGQIKNYLGTKEKELKNKK